MRQAGLDGWCETPYRIIEDWPDLVTAFTGEVLRQICYCKSLGRLVCLPVPYKIAGCFPLFSTGQKPTRACSKRHMSHMSHRARVNVDYRSLLLSQDFGDRANSHLPHKHAWQHRVCRGLIPVLLASIVASNIFADSTVATRSWCRQLPGLDLSLSYSQD